jgi:hypothetical protein
VNSAKTHPLLQRSGFNSQENIWQFMRQNWLTHRILKSFDDLDHSCYAWTTLIDHPQMILSIAHRNSAIVGQLL